MSSGDTVQRAVTRMAARLLFDAFGSTFSPYPTTVDRFKEAKGKRTKVRLAGKKIPLEPGSTNLPLKRMFEIPIKIQSARIQSTDSPSQRLMLRRTFSAHNVERAVPIAENRRNPDEESIADDLTGFVE